MVKWWIITERGGYVLNEPWMWKISWKQTEMLFSKARYPVWGNWITCRAKIEKEVLEALNKMKTRNAWGLYGHLEKCFKTDDSTVLDWLLIMLTGCFGVSMVPIHKGKCVKYESNKTKAISLLSVVGIGYTEVCWLTLNSTTYDCSLC